MAERLWTGYCPVDRCELRLFAEWAAEPSGIAPWIPCPTCGLPVFVRLAEV